MCAEVIQTKSVDTPVLRGDVPGHRVVIRLVEMKVLGFRPFEPSVRVGI